VQLPPPAPAPVGDRVPITIDAGFRITTFNLLVLGNGPSDNTPAEGDHWADCIEVAQVAMSSLDTGAKVAYSPAAIAILSPHANVGACVSSERLGVIVTPEVFHVLARAEVRLRGAAVGCGRMPAEPSELSCPRLG
jgi:hypothetical protein